MKKLLFIVLVLCLTVGTARADLLAEYNFDTDASDSANGYDGILSQDGAMVIQGALLLAGGGYMDLPASFGAVNPFDGSGDFTIEMDFMSDTGGILISSARDDTPDNHAMSVYLQVDWGEVVYDNFWVGAAGAGGEDFNPGDGAWHSLRVAYDVDGGGLITEEWWEGPESEWNYAEWGDPEDDWDEDGTPWVGGDIMLPEEEWYGAALIEVTLLDGQDWAWTADFNPEIPDIHLDTVSLGRSLNAEFPYEELPDPAGWAIGLDNVRIYNHYVPEPATMLLLGLGGLGLLRRRRN